MAKRGCRSELQAARGFLGAATVSAHAGMPRVCACSHVKALARRGSTDFQQAPESTDFPIGLVGLLLNAYKIHENPAIVSTGL